MHKERKPGIQLYIPLSHTLTFGFLFIALVVRACNMLLCRLEMAKGVPIPSVWGWRTARLSLTQINTVEAWFGEETWSGTLSHSDNKKKMYTEPIWGKIFPLLELGVAGMWSKRNLEVISAFNLVALGMFWMMNTSVLLEPSSPSSGPLLKFSISASTAPNLMSGRLVSELDFRLVALDLAKAANLL